jgi:hypothetical protein
MKMRGDKVSPLSATLAQALSSASTHNSTYAFQDLRFLTQARVAFYRREERRPHEGFGLRISDCESAGDPLVPALNSIG